MLAEVSLTDLTSLTTLELSGNTNLAEVSLSGLTSLTTLELSNNQNADVSHLSRLKSLTTLELSNNEIADVSPLARLTRLTTLELSNNEIEDVSPLAGLASLTTLGLSGNAIADVSPLAGLASLTTLELSSNAIEDVSPLARLGSLVSLGLSGNAIADVSWLGGLRWLASLRLSSNAIEDISPLSRLTSLTTLHLSGNAIADVTALSRLWLLNVALLDDNAIFDISPLGGLDQLSFLALSRNAVADIRPLLSSGLPEDARNYRDISGNYVDLRGNPLSDGQADHVLALRESGTAVVFDDGGHRVPLFPSAARSLATGASVAGFVRVINHSDEAGGVWIEAIDENGQSWGWESLAIDAGQALHFNAEDLEQGSPTKGLHGIGEGVGDWRLVLRSELDIEVLGYARTLDGFVTSLHDLAPEAYGTSRVPTFNPGSNRRQVSRLRLTNPTGQTRLVEFNAWDDVGERAPVQTRGTSGFRWSGTWMYDGSNDWTAAQLESSSNGVAGLGDGTGKWRLDVYAPGQRVMSLLQSPTGHLANISTGTAVRGDDRAYHSWRGGRYRVPLFLAASSDIHGFLRIVNLSSASAAITLRAIGESGGEREPVVLTLRGGRALHLNSNDLESGNAAKGLPGIGPGMGDWHLEVSGDRRFEVLAYARTADGFVTSLHDTAPRDEDGSLWVPFFNPGSNRTQASRLRLVNWGETAADVAIAGTDDAGNSPGEAVRVTCRRGRRGTTWRGNWRRGAPLACPARWATAPASGGCGCPRPPTSRR